MKIRSYAMKLAHAIKKQNIFLSWGQCQKQAWKVARLKDAMQTRIVNFIYQKQNGEVRTAKGTLSGSFFNYETKNSKRNDPMTAIKYFDWDKQAFRSFRAERIL